MRSRNSSGPNFYVDANDATFSDQLAQAGRVDERPAVSHPRFDDYIRLERKDDLLIAKHVVWKLDHWRAEPGESVSVFLIPGDLEPEISYDREAFVGVNRHTDAVIEQNIMAFGVDLIFM